MENYKRKLESLIKWDELLKKKPHTTNKFTLILVGRLGKARSLQMAFWPLLWLVISAGIYLLASCFIIGDYVYLRQKAHSQAIFVEHLESETDHQEKTIAGLRQDNALLSNYILSLEGSAKLDTNLPVINVIKKSEMKPATLPAPAKKEVKSATEPSTAADPSTPKNAIEVQGLIVKKHESLLNISLKIVNPDATENTFVEGYLLLIGFDRKTDPPRIWTYPYVKVVNDLPENFRRGQRFAIQRFREMYGSLTIPPGSDYPTTIKVLIYSTEGVLTLNKEYEIGDAL